MSTITWKNVEKLSSDDMGRAFMNDAQKSGNTALDGLGGIVKNFQTTADANQVVTKENATNEFMRQLLSAKNSQELTGMQPTLNDMLAARGAGIDQKAAMQAMDSRGGVLQARDTATTAFNTAQEVEKQRPLVEAYRVLSQKGDKIGMAAFEAANPGIRNMSTLMGDARAIEDGKVSTELANRKGNQDITNSIATAAASTSNAASNAINATTNVGQLDVARENARLGAMDRISERISKASAAATDINKQSILSADGQATVIDGLKIVADPAQRAELVTMAGQAMKDPANASISATSLLSTLLGQQHRRTWLGAMFGTSVHRASDFTRDIETARNAEINTKGVVEREVMKGMALGRVQDLTAELKKLQYPGAVPVTNTATEQPVSSVPQVPTGEQIAADTFERKKNEAAAAANKKPDTTLLKKQASLELAEKSAGVLKELSPEVKVFLDDQENIKTLAKKELQKSLMVNGANPGMGAYGLSAFKPIDSIEALAKQRTALEKEFKDAAKKKQ